MHGNLNMKKLFENVEGNKFKLISENIEESEPKSSLVRKGLKKVFSEGEKEYSYKKLQGVGMGYIRDIAEAKKCALQEARELALEFGYRDEEEEQKFVKEIGHSEYDMGNSEEKREVQIGKRLITLSHQLNTTSHGAPSAIKAIQQDIETIAQELIDLHTGKAVTKPGTGGVSYKPGSIY